MQSCVSVCTCAHMLACIYWYRGHGKNSWLSIYILYVVLCDRFLFISFLCFINYWFDVYPENITRQRWCKHSSAITVTSDVHLWGSSFSECEAYWWGNNTFIISSYPSKRWCCWIRWLGGHLPLSGWLQVCNVWLSDSWNTSCTTAEPSLFAGLHIIILLVNGRITVTAITHHSVVMVRHARLYTAGCISLLVSLSSCLHILWYRVYLECTCHNF